MARFDSDTSHKLKSPVTGIQMVLHLLAEGTAGPLTAKQAELLKKAISDCDRLVQNLEDLLRQDPHRAEEEM